MGVADGLTRMEFISSDLKTVFRLRESGVGPEINVSGFVITGGTGSVYGSFLHPEITIKRQKASSRIADNFTILKSYNSFLFSLLGRPLIICRQCNKKVSSFKRAAWASNFFVLSPSRFLFCSFTSILIKKSLAVKGCTSNISLNPTADRN